MDSFLRAAYEEAQKGENEGGIPIGSVLVIDGQIVGRGHNQRVQKGSVILHAEMSALENAGRLSPSTYQNSVLYTTLSPCKMCSGAILLYKIPRVVIGENQNFQGNEGYLIQNNVRVDVLNDQDCIGMMEAFIQNNPQLWFEDIGEDSKDKDC
ncbi:MAG: tRNA-specific adenosine deaminase [Chloroflexi bacterium 44-23]|nr:MAG: tRNA-specific adenosine deaminase [Chloroflexi bacterium 44-23]